MRMKKNKNHKGKSMPGLYSSIRRNIAELFGVEKKGIPICL